MVSVLVGATVMGAAVVALALLSTQSPTQVPNLMFRDHAPTAPAPHPPPDHFRVRCPIHFGEPEPLWVEFFEFGYEGDDWVGPRRGKAIAAGDMVHFHPTKSDGAGSLAIHGYQSLAITWFWDPNTGEGRCVDDVLVPTPLEGGLGGTVLDAAGNVDGSMWVEGCGSHRIPIDADGDFFFYPRAGPCTLRAYRQDGALVVGGNPIEVNPWEVETPATLRLPPWAPAGVGIELARHPQGFSIARVFKQSPAHRAGLRPRDVILGIDGIRAAGMGFDEFIALAIGEEGTEVELLVSAQSQVRAVGLEREHIPADAPQLVLLPD